MTEKTETLRLRDRIAETMARADGWEWAAANFSSLSTPATDRYRRCADAVLAVLPETTDRTALDRIRAMHQPVEGLGYDSDEDDTPGSYGDIAQVCSSCGTPGEYGVRWPCPTIRALDGECPQCGDAGACNGGPCPLRLADEVAVPGRADNETGETEAHPPTTTWKVESPRRDQWASWGTTYDDHDWARESYEHAAAHAHARAFRLVRATTTYTVEAVHTPAADAPAVGGAQPKEA